MASSTSKNIDEGCPDGYQTVTKSTNLPGIELDLDELQKLYPQYGARIRIVIMDDGARPAGAGDPKRDEYCLRVPPKSGGGGGTR